MLELPPKFKSALGNGIITSLFPVIRFYKDVRLDEPDTWSEAESVNLSIKDTNLDGIAFDPLLLNAPSINSSADIINNKYTISSVSLSISNAPYRGKIFSDDIQNLLNAVCQVYYCANGLDSLEDCLLVYTGTVRRFNQSAESIKLELEDITEQMLSTQIPSTLIPDDVTYKEDDIGKPYPMVYGFIDKSPLILKRFPDPETGQLYESISNLIIDKPNQQISGAWNLPLEKLYKNDYIQQTMLLSDDIITDEHYLFVYSDSFVPINRRMPKQWTFRYQDEESNEEKIYETTTLDGKILYNIDNDSTYGPSIKISSEAHSIMSQIEDFTDSGIPSRIYRPVTKVGFFAKNKNSVDGTLNRPDDENKIYGFTNLDTSKWDPRDEVVTHNTLDQYNINDDSPAKDEYISNWQTGDMSWWEPTDINELVPPINGETLQWTYKDFNRENDAINGLFPASYVQDGNINTGIHITSQNYTPSGEVYPNSGCFSKLSFDKSGSFSCVTKCYYVVTYYQPQNIEWGNLDGGAQTHHLMVPSSLFLEPILATDHIVASHYGAYSLNSLLAGQDMKGYIPHKDDNNEEGILEKDNGDDSINNGASAKVKGNQISNLFKNTSSFDSIQWGIPNIRVNAEGPPRNMQSCVANLHEFYTVQDILVNDIINQDYFGSVKGRVDEFNSDIKTATEIIKDILKNELIYSTEIQEISIGNDWIYGFTLNEQREAKEVFEGLFKASLIIPSFDSKGQFKFIPLKQIIDTTEGLPIINNEDVIKYSFELSKIDDVYNQVNVKYKKNYGSGEFDKETGYSLIDADDNEYETYDEVTESIYPDQPENQYSIDYYGLESDEAKLEVETEYVRDELTARKLQKRLVSWYANQHLITKIDLPVNYMNLEVGDYIRFDELLGGKLAFGQDYTIHTNKNGQLVYPVFFITKINKSLQKISIEAIQIHRGEYGFPSDLEDEEDYVDGGGNNGQGNHDFPDPNDNPDYNQDTIIEEDFEEDLQIEPYFDSSWLNQQNNITQNPITAIVSTNIEQDWDYDISISQVYTSTGEGITYENHSGEQITIPDGIFNEENAPSAMDLVNHIKSTSDMEDNYNGQVLISKKFVFEMDEYPEEVQVDFIIKIYNDNNVKYLEFNQKGEYTGVDILGDVNGDGGLNVLDVVMVLGAILNQTEDELENADMNGDGIVNVQDLIVLVNEILGQ